LASLTMINCHVKILTILSLFLLFPILASSKCSSTCEADKDQNQKTSSDEEALKYKKVAMGTILLASAIGVCLPFLVKNISYLAPDKDIFFVIKAFAAGVILATGFIHVLPDAVESLTSPCLSENPWHKFPFTGFVAMLSAIGTLMMESFATGYHKRSELRKAQPVNGDEESDHQGHGHGHEGHVHGSAFVLEKTNASDLLRHRVISQVTH
ncbi:Zip domain-containing protein, partial [Cephalotus follicularis]